MIRFCWDLRPPLQLACLPLRPAPSFALLCVMVGHRSSQDSRCAGELEHGVIWRFGVLPKSTPPPQKNELGLFRLEIAYSGLFFNTKVVQQQYIKPQTGQICLVLQPRWYTCIPWLYAYGQLRGWRESYLLVSYLLPRLKAHPILMVRANWQIY